MFHQLLMKLMKNSQKKKRSECFSFSYVFYRLKALTTIGAMPDSKKISSIGQISTRISHPPSVRYRVLFGIELVDLFLSDNIPKGSYRQELMYHHYYT